MLDWDKPTHLEIAVVPEVNRKIETLLGFIAIELYRVFPFSNKFIF